MQINNRGRGKIAAPALAEIIYKKVLTSKLCCYIIKKQIKLVYSAATRAGGKDFMAAKFQLELLNGVKEARKERGWSQGELAQMVGVSRNTISSIETGAFNPTAKLAAILCIALDKKFEELFWFAE